MSDKCVIEGCDGPRSRMGLYCPKHYWRVKRHGSPHVRLKVGAKVKVGKPCAVEGCGSKAVARGMCNPCYQKWNKAQHRDGAFGVLDSGVGDVEGPPCLVAGCGGVRYSGSKRFCRRHEMEVRSHGYIVSRAV